MFLNGFGSVVCFVFGGKCVFGYYIKGVGWVDFNDVFSIVFCKEYILGFNLFNG